MDTVLYAIGRAASTGNLRLEQANVQVAPRTNKILTDDEDRSVSQPNVFSLGDTAEGRPELTPAAVQAGKLLAERLFAGSKKLMNYRNVAFDALRKALFLS